MRLFKNVDINDLENILVKGILSLDASGNDNWQDGKRANNATDKVYLFCPKNRGDVFPQYGAALIECETRANQNEMSEYDSNKEKYEEYVNDYVSPDEIVAIYVPEGFMRFVSDSVKDKVTPVKMTAKMYVRKATQYIGKYEYTFGDAPDEMIEIFYNSAPAKSTDAYGYFRGVYPNNREVFDLYEVKYEI